jgi:hypothetical protein
MPAKIALAGGNVYGKEINNTPVEDVSDLSAYRANTVSEDLTGGERKQNVNCWLELSHELHFAISIPKIVECLCFFLKNVKYRIGRTATSELGGDWIRDNVLPRLLGVLLQGSIEDRLELRRRLGCVQGGIRGHDGGTKTRWTPLTVEIRTCWGCICTSPRLYVFKFTLPQMQSKCSTSSQDQRQPEFVPDTESRRTLTLTQPEP